MKSASDIVLKLLGVLLLMAAVLKSWQLLAEPMANNDIWTNRAFLIFTVEFEIALGIWLISSLFKKAAWLAVLGCFSLFSVITLYKGLSGVESCGCFGSVQVNPWITLFAVDLPAVIALSIFRLDLSSLKERCMSFLRRQESTHSLIKEFLSPPLSLPRLVVTVFVTVIVLCITTSVLALNEPPKQTPDYIVLEPETWVGQKLPILQHIDICQQLEKGNWLILLYHHDCPDCTAAIPKYEQMARDLAGSEGFLRIALIEVPPYGKAMVNNNSPCALGRLASSKEWFITTPAVVLLEDSIVRNVWEGKTLSFDAVCRSAGM